MWLSCDSHVILWWSCDSFYYCSSGMQAQRNSSEPKVTSYTFALPHFHHLMLSLHPPLVPLHPVISSPSPPHSFPSPPVTPSKFYKPSVGENCKLITLDDNRWHTSILLHLLTLPSLLSFLAPSLLSFLAPSLLSFPPSLLSFPPSLLSFLTPSLHQGTKNYRAFLSLLQP